MSRLLPLFVIGLATAASYSAHPIVAPYERFYADATESAHVVEGGLLLLNELNCVACHAAPAGWNQRLPGRGRIDLTGVNQRLAGAHVAEFIGSPAKMKPGTVMPGVVADDREAQAIANYLAGLNKSTSKVRTFPAGDAKRGKKLFEGVGCAACHASENGTTTYPSVPLALAQRYERGALIEFLLNPLHSRPAGRMPATQVSVAEAADLAAYLQPQAPRQPATAPRGDVALGARQFAARNCAACHDVGDAVTPPMATPLARVRVGQGCLASKPALGAPDFVLSEKQSRSLAAALREIQATPVAPALNAEQRVSVKFEQLNCHACHEWRGRGGVEPARAKFFTATESAVESLGEIGHLPPKLDQAGRKLTPAWLEKLLWGEGGGVRPYMTARMPRFGKLAAGDLVSLLGEACRPAQPEEIDTSGSVGHQRYATGRTLLGIGTGGLGCVSCHGIKNREPSGVRAINLTHTAQRVQPEYFKALLLNPQSVQPGTIMPPLLAGRKGAEKEVESIWTYFKELDQSNVLPEGLAVAGSFELKPKEEGRAIVFRTFMEGAGMQAVAVGFPAELNAAFDSFEVRWALAWGGRFLDAQTNWEERPMKPIKPLGDQPRTLPNHMPFAQLGAPSETWPSKFGTYAGYRFLGYRIAADGTPTFRYTIGALAVEDTLRPVAGGGALRRTVKVRSQKGDEAGWYFRGLDSAHPAQPLEWRDGAAVFEETISLR